MKDELMFMVSVDGQTAPSAIHPTFNAARIEAERLCGMSQNRGRCVRVLQLIGTYVPSTTHQWNAV